MEKTIIALVERFGSQGKAAIALGITDRTFRNYVKKPECVPKPMRRLMESVLRDSDEGRYTLHPPIQDTPLPEARA